MAPISSPKHETSSSPLAWMSHRKPARPPFSPSAVRRTKSLSLPNLAPSQFILMSQSSAPNSPPPPGRLPSQAWNYWVLLKILAGSSSSESSLLCLTPFMGRTYRPGYSPPFYVQTPHRRVSNQGQNHHQIPWKGVQGDFVVWPYSRPP